MFGIAQWVIVIAILAFLYLLFRYGARPVVMMILGGVSLVFLAGLCFVLAVRAHRADVYPPYDYERSIVLGPGAGRVEARQWRRRGPYGPPRGRFVYDRTEHPEATFSSSEERWPRGGRSENWVNGDWPVGKRGGSDWTGDARSGTWSASAGAGELAEVVTEVDPLVAGAAAGDEELAEDEESPGDSRFSNASQRPAWVDQPAGKTDGGAYVTTTYVGPFKTLNEAEAAVAVEIQRSANEHINRLIEPDAAQIVNLPMQYIDERIVTDIWQEKVDHEIFGEMMNLHARLRFDETTHRDIRNHYKNAVIAGRLIAGGIGASALILLLATVYGYLKLDTATKGYYSGRLRVAAAGMILAIVAVGVLLVGRVI